jgi:hypothetical protein
VLLACRCAIEVSKEEFQATGDGVDVPGLS